MVAKTFAGLETVLAQELRSLGAEEVEPGIRMVSFRGDQAMLYKANLCCRTALRILKPFYKFKARDAEELYDKVKEYDWNKTMRVDQTFSIDTVAYSDSFRHSQYATYRVKDGIVDWFRDHTPNEERPRVRLEQADIMLNVHISGNAVTLSLDSSGESLHRRGYRRAQTEAPINEVLAAGIIMLSGWDGTTPFVDPMCGSGTFVIEAALIAANIIPGVFRQHYAFENWADFDRELFEEIYNDDSGERSVEVPIVGADISPRAIEIARQNAKGAGVANMIELKVQKISDWTRAPQPAGVMVTNPPYGKRISAPDMEALYESIGTVLKRVFVGYKAWIIGYTDEYFNRIGLAPSQKLEMNNGGLDCELREYVIFEGSKREFRAKGGAIKDEKKIERKYGARRREEESRRPQAGKFRDKERKPSRPFRRPDEMRDDERRPFRTSYPTDRTPRESRDEQRRRKFDPDKLGRQPSIPAEKAIDMRPTWKARNFTIRNNDEPENKE